MVFHIDNELPEWSKTWSKNSKDYWILLELRIDINNIPVNFVVVNLIPCVSLKVIFDTVKKLLNQDYSLSSRIYMDKL